MGDTLANQEETRGGAEERPKGAKMSRLRCDMIMEGFGVLAALHDEVVKYANEYPNESERVAAAARKEARRIANAEYKAVVEDSMKKRRAAMHAAEKDHADSVEVARALKVKRLAEIEAQYVEASAWARNEGLRVRSAIGRAGDQVRKMEEEVMRMSPDAMSREDYRKGVHKEVNARMKAFYEEVSRKEDIGLDETILVSSAETTGTVDFYEEVLGGEDMGLDETIMVSSTETTGTIDIASSEDGTGSGEKLQEVLGAAGVVGGERDVEGRDAEVGVSTPGQVPVPQEWIALAEGVGMSVEGSGEETEARMRESE